MPSLKMTIRRLIARLSFRRGRTRLCKPDSERDGAASPGFATAQDVPPELFDYILKFIVSTDAWAPPDPWKHLVSQVQMTKRELGLLALTCRYWNSRCQPLIFDTIRLRSRSDVYDLLEFLTQEECRIVQYIRTLIVEQTGFSDPWIHLVELELDRIMDRRRLGLKNKQSWLMELKLDTPFPLHLRRGFRICSINATLPRSPPASVERYGKLHLNNIHFHRFEDLMRLVAEMPNLSQLRGQKLIWDDEPQSRPPRRSAKLHPSVVFIECSNRWSPIWLITGATWPRPALSYITQEYMVQDQENQSLCKICRSISDGVDSAKYPLAATVVKTRTYPSTEIIEYGNVIEGTDRALEVACVPTLSFSCVTPREWPPGGVRFAHIDIVTVDFRELSSIQDSLLCKWKDFEDHVLKLNDVRKVILGFKTQEDMLTFKKDVLDTIMPRLMPSEKLILAVDSTALLRRSRQTWRTAVRDADADQEIHEIEYSEARECLLHDL